MNEMQVFQNSEFGELGVLEINGKPYFPATACAKKLGYTNPQKAIRDHCKGVNETFTPTKGGTQRMKIIPEGDLYRLIVHSKLPTAERFEKWVFDEVLPTIRQTGGYGNQAPTVDGWLDKLVQVTANLTQVVTVMAQVLERESSITMSEPFPTEFSYQPNKLKLETFPPEIVRKVEEMMTEMEEQQKLNFSMIARYCTGKGYMISSPSVRRYYDKYFNKN